MQPYQFRSEPAYRSPTPYQAVPYQRYDATPQPGQVIPEVVIPREPARPAHPTRQDIDQLPTARTDEQFNSAVDRAQKRGVPLIVTFTDKTSHVSGEELRMLASAKKQYGDKAEILVIDRSKLEQGSKLASHFDSYVARQGYPTTMLARPSEGLRPSDLKAGSAHVVDCRYGADFMMLGKLPALKQAVKPEAPKAAPTRDDPFNPESFKVKPARPERPPTTDASIEKPKIQEKPRPQSFEVTTQEDYNKVLRAAGESKQPMVALFYSSSSPHSARAVREYMEARKNVPGATYMAFDVDKLDQMSPDERQKSPIASYADYVRREVGYPTTMIVPIAPPTKPGESYSPRTNSATFRGGASAEQIQNSLESARQVMSQFKFPEPPRKAEPPKVEQKPEKTDPKPESRPHHSGPRMYA